MIDFPVITNMDMVRAQESLLDHFGIKLYALLVVQWENAIITIVQLFQIKLFLLFQ